MDKKQETDKHLDVAQKKVNLKEAFREMEELLEEHMKIYKVIAQHLRIFYDELLAAGFTKQEALDIVKSWGVLDEW